MQATVITTTRMFAGATAVTALGLLTVAPPVQAAPGSCSQYAMNGDFIIHGGNIGEVKISPANGTKVVGDTFTIGDGGEAVHGFVQDGAIQGRDINFKISWIVESDPVWTFSGTVSDDGLVHRGLMHGAGFMSLWDSTTPLACNDPEIATKPLPGNRIIPPAPATPRVPGPVTAP